MSSAIAIRTIPPRPSSLPRWLGWVALAAIIVGVGYAGTRLVQGPHVIPHMTIVNPSKYAVEVETTGAKRDGWTVLGATPPVSSTTLDDVIDQGRIWVFRVHAQGVSGGDFVMSRALLARSRWQVTIPSNVIDKLAAQPISASPTTTSGTG